MLKKLFLLLIAAAAVIPFSGEPLSANQDTSLTTDELAWYGGGWGGHHGWGGGWGGYRGYGGYGGYRGYGGYPYWGGGYYYPYYRPYNYYYPYYYNNYRW